MKTKESILHCAINLYNKHGLRNINSRTIAKELGKSHGNIEYHFKTKEDIVLAIYENMTIEIANFYEQNDSYLNSFERFNVLLNELEIFQLKYSFFNLDVLEITRNFPKVDILLQKTLNKRKKQMHLFFKSFIDEGLILKNESTNYYLRLQHTIRILITFWLNQEKLLTSYKLTKQGEMAKHIWSLIFPLMTKKGQVLYFNIINNKAAQ